MDAIKFLFEAQPIRTKLPVGRLLNTKHGQNSIRANDINTEHGIEVDKQCSSTKPMFKERDTVSTMYCFKLCHIIINSFSPITCI